MKTLKPFGTISSGVLRVSIGDTNPDVASALVRAFDGVEAIDIAGPASAFSQAALIETIEGEGHLLVENVAVAPNFQGRGLGRFLMAHAERLAAARGHAEMRLYTNQRFAENIRLYLALGYRIDREEQSALGVTVYMSKPVSASPVSAPNGTAL